MNYFSRIFLYIVLKHTPLLLKNIWISLPPLVYGVYVHGISMVMHILPYYFKAAYHYPTHLHKEEPPQNPNKSAKKCSFFMGIFTWLEPG